VAVRFLFEINSLPELPEFAVMAEPTAQEIDDEDDDEEPDIMVNLTTICSPELSLLD
jgi:hypothetical protein